MSQTINLTKQINLIKLTKLSCNYKKKILQLELHDAYRQLDYCYKSLNNINQVLYRTVPNNIVSTFICSQGKTLNIFYLLTRNKLNKKITSLKNKTYNNIKSITYYIKQKTDDITHNEIIKTRTIKTYHRNYDFSLKSELQTHTTTKIENKPNHINLIDNSNKNSANKPELQPQKITKIEIKPNLINQIENFKKNYINNKWFINLTNINIPNNVIKLLQLGERFAIPVRNNIFKVTLETIKDVENNIKNFDHSSKQNIRNQVFTSLNSFINNITTHTLRTRLIK